MPSRQHMPTTQMPPGGAEGRASCITTMAQLMTSPCGKLPSRVVLLAGDQVQCRWLLNLLQCRLLQCCLLQCHLLLSGAALLCTHKRRGRAAASAAWQQVPARAKQQAWDTHPPFKLLEVLQEVVEANGGLSFKHTGARDQIVCVDERVRVCVCIHMFMCLCTCLPRSVQAKGTACYGAPRKQQAAACVCVCVCVCVCARPFWSQDRNCLVSAQTDTNCGTHAPVSVSLFFPLVTKVNPLVSMATPAKGRARLFMRGTFLAKATFVPCKHHPASMKLCHAA